MEMVRGIVKEFQREKVWFLKSSGFISVLFCDDDEVLEVSGERKQKSKMLRLLLSHISRKNTQYFCPLLYVFKFIVCTKFADELNGTG